MATLTAQRLREILHYDPDTGVFTWRVDRNQLARAGTVAGTGDGKGYLQVRVDGVKHRAHRLAWLYMQGEWPPFELDHRNRTKSDNRCENLRPSTRSANLQNQRNALRNNACGLLGVSKKKTNQYVARIKADGRSHYLGAFRTAEAAHAAYLTAKQQYHTAGGEA